MPYLRIFEGENGVKEVDLISERVLIGRQDGIADVRIVHRTVSRAHAVIHRIKGHFFIEDANSRSGTFVNGDRVNRKTLLRHGSSIQLGECVVEYRDDDATRKQERDRIMSMHGIRRKVMLDFNRMPESIRIRYRSLSITPEDVFSTGDTLLVADGGIMVESNSPLSTGSCMELEITAPGRHPKAFAGEVLILDEEIQPPTMGVKLHNPENDRRYREAVLNCRRGSWVLAQRGQEFTDF